MSLLSVTDLAKSFGGVQAVRGVSFDVRPGELLALIGPNGAGKSTCFNMLNGQIAPDAGRIRLAGEDITGLPPRKVWARGVGRTFQITATYGSMTVLENVQTAIIAHERRVYRFWRPMAGQLRERAHALLAQVGMTDQSDRACSVLAYGDVKRVELAMALGNEPKLLLMDEPTAGMAPRERNELMALTHRLVEQRGIAVLFTEHSMDVVFAYANRIMVLARGEFIAEGSAAAIRDDPRVREVYLGTGAAFERRERAAT